MPQNRLSRIREEAEDVEEVSQNSAKLPETKPRQKVARFADQPSSPDLLGSPPKSPSKPSDSDHHKPPTFSQKAKARKSVFVTS